MALSHEQLYDAVNHQSPAGELDDEYDEVTQRALKDHCSKGLGLRERLGTKHRDSKADKYENDADLSPLDVM